jgi:hypothetical protein
MHMRWIPSAVLLAAAAGACSSQPAAPSPATPAAALTDAATDARGGRAATTGVVFVRTQGLYYDTFVAKDPLPMHGRFQLLEDGETDYGPGDPQYLGGRWWEDLNGNQMQDEGDHFFLCPLLPPGRATP